MRSSPVSHLNFRFCDWFEQWVSWNSGNYRVRTHSETRMWRGKNIQSIKLLCNFIEITPWHGCSPVNLLLIFRTPFSKNTSGWLLMIYPLFSLHLLAPHRALLVKIKENNKLKLTEKKGGISDGMHGLFFSPCKFRSSVIKKLLIIYEDKLKYMSSKQNTMWY